MTDPLRFWAYSLRFGFGLFEGDSNSSRARLAPDSFPGQDLLSESAAAAAAVPFAGGDATGCGDGPDGGRAGGKGACAGREGSALEGAWGAAGAGGVSAVADVSRLGPMIAR